MHLFVRYGSTAKPTKPAKNPPTPLPIVSSPRANSFSSGETCRETAWGDCTTMIPATRPKVEHRTTIIQIDGRKWYQDSNRKNNRCPISKAATAITEILKFIKMCEKFLNIYINS